MSLLPPVSGLMTLHVSATHTQAPDDTSWGLRLVVLEEPDKNLLVATSRVEADSDGTRATVIMGAAFRRMSDDDVESFLAGDVEREVHSTVGNLLFSQSIRTAAQLAAMRGSSGPKDKYVEPTWGGVKRVPVEGDAGD